MVRLVLCSKDAKDGQSIVMFWDARYGQASVM
jgi:hypothetical protein